MSDVSIKYTFAVVLTTYEEGGETISYGMNCNQFPMLRHLSNHELKSTKKIIAHLEEVIAGALTEYYWGGDFCDIESQKENSILHHHLTERGIDLNQHFYTEIPTATLLKIMKDWKVFLTRNPKNTFGNRE